MTYTYNTPNPHGRCRDLLIEEMLLALEREPQKGEDKEEE